MDGWLADIQARRDHNLPEIARSVAAEFRIYGHTAESLMGPLSWFIQDNHDKTPDEMAEMAEACAPGGAHDAAYLVNLVREHIPFPCPRLVAATIRAVWQGGKAGFQFLPDPARTSPDEYETAVMDLTDDLDAGDSIELLTGDDKAFYDSLPNRFSVYRGCHGITAEQAAAGLCWLTQRPVARWFAGRGLRDELPVLISARVHKRSVRLAFASEFEVVVQPRRWRQLKLERVRPDHRPVMEWAAKAPTAAETVPQLTVTA